MCWTWGLELHPHNTVPNVFDMGSGASLHNTVPNVLDMGSGASLPQHSSYCVGHGVWSFTPTTQFLMDECVGPGAWSFTRRAGLTPTTQFLTVILLLLLNPDN
eukprot:TRINITY_DN99034_c0_g1_i1.p1 TRINITY_DN99034_c0_g1~~TRINITY_DN99034_c0_g1_i1.p1  ORF type:complete len:103 (-),score=12.84 TRINITY_DN99034_c0_g1_i1:31-339(-)